MPTGGGGGGGAPLDPDYVILTLGGDPDLPNERILTAGSGIKFTDLGPNSTLTISAGGAVALGVNQNVKLLLDQDAGGEDYWVSNSADNTVELFLNDVSQVKFGASAKFAVDVFSSKFLGGDTSGGDLTLESTSNATKGKVRFGATGSAFYDETSRRMFLGDREAGALLGGSYQDFVDGAVQPGLQAGFGAITTGASAGVSTLLLQTYRTANANMLLSFSRARGDHPSLGTALTVLDDDFLGRVEALGHTGATFNAAGRIQFLADGNVTGGQVPGEIEFLVNGGPGGLVTNLSMRASGETELHRGGLERIGDTTFDFKSGKTTSGEAFAFQVPDGVGGFDTFLSMQDESGNTTMDFRRGDGGSGSVKSNIISLTGVSAFQAISYGNNATTNNGIFSGSRARNTISNPADTSDNDILLEVNGNGFADSGFRVAATISWKQDGAISGTHVPGEITFATDDGSAFSERVRIRANGNLEVLHDLIHTGTNVALYSGTTPRPQAGAITKPILGGTIDAEARTAIDALIDAIGASLGIGVTA